MRFWIGVASRDHVRKGVEGGFCQLNHGKASALRRISPGDWIAYYSPKTALRDGEPVQAFTAIGRVKDGEVYNGEMGGGFAAARRDVAFVPANEAPIRPLLDRLSFIRDKQSWGYVFRLGHFEVEEADFATIAKAMGVPSLGGTVA